LGGGEEADLTAEPVELFEELTDGVVTLRPWRLDDVPALVEACSDPTITRWLPNMPSPYTEADGREFIEEQPKRNAEGSGNVGVFDAQTGGLLGACGFGAERSERFEFGYWVASAHRGRGIAPRALRLIARWVAENTVVGRLQLHADVENIASQRVAEKAGFTREGVQRSWMDIRGERRDMVSYSLLPDEIV
jgi:ribosomal-protein-alanine N-acetyltransferase